MQDMTGYIHMQASRGMDLNTQGWRFCNQEAGNNCAVPAHVTSPDHPVEGNGGGGGGCLGMVRR